MMERVIDLEGTLNFRDLGGYPTQDGRTVRWRRVFRSDALHRLTPADVARLRGDLGLQGVIDLRSSYEVRGDGRGLLGEESVAFHHIPLFDGDTRASEQPAALLSLADRYVMLADFAREAIGRVVSILATSDGPVVYHCAAGKDRTGVISAVILGVLGVDDAVIAVDYAATQQNLDAIIGRLMAAESYRTMLGALPPDTLHAEPQTMVEFLTRVRDRYGSMRGFVQAAGVSDESLHQLEARLLDER